MFKIGEFSKLVQVPAATLRYYDQLGLLKPVEVDKFTGYRYYSASQLPRLRRILALRGLGFSLEQIGEVLDDELSIEQMRGMLRLRHAQISQQLNEVRDQLTEVEARLRQIEEEEALSAYDVMVKQTEPLLIAYVRAILPAHSASGSLFPEVYEAIGEHVGEALGPNPGEGGQTLVLWYDTEFKETEVDGAAAFILRCPVPERGRMRVETLPATTVAATVHHGSYNSIGAAHEAVLQWIEVNGCRIVGPDREIYLYNTHPVRLDDPSYVTEIQYPVEKAERISREHFLSLNSQGERSMTVKTTQPKVEARAAQHYVAIRSRVPSQDFPTLIPECIDAVAAWLAEQGLQPAGPPLMRYHVIDMAAKMDVAIGFPVAQPLSGSGRIIADMLPAGRYASLIYTGVENGIAGNAALIGWAKEQGLQWDRWDDDQGDAFAGRVEYFLDGPDDDPDPANWDTEVAIKVKDD